MCSMNVKLKLLFYHPDRPSQYQQRIAGDTNPLAHKMVWANTELGTFTTYDSYV